MRFAIDFIGKRIIGTKASFDKASKGNGAIYEELAEKIAKHPSFELVIKEQKQHITKAKKTYENLTFKLMEDFISIQENAKETLSEYEAVKKMAKNAGRSIYPITKKWFLSVYEDFDVEDAKRAIRDSLISNAAKSVA